MRDGCHFGQIRHDSEQDYEMPKDEWKIRLEVLVTASKIVLMDLNSISQTCPWHLCQNARLTLARLDILRLSKELDVEIWIINKPLHVSVVHVA